MNQRLGSGTWSDLIYKQGLEQQAATEEAKVPELLALGSGDNSAKMGRGSPAPCQAAVYEPIPFTPTRNCAAVLSHAYSKSLRACFLRLGAAALSTSLSLQLLHLHSLARRDVP
ncbi:hypothetical protein CDV31_016608 [Fusarium ambrosium]|uniref:Uncharacterized protein n=1 Tax=Fusarium ambrosium TaxID=131363 RepID=A0A428S5R9_9HYPO|nr:hypothetical protein CDV31_016608 [Fusarium ambrosium]